jgi:hypothetical protein
MAKYAENKLDKTIVTTPEACKNLTDSMAETSKVILGLITDMDWPAPGKTPEKKADEAGEKTP